RAGHGVAMHRRVLTQLLQHGVRAFAELRIERRQFENAGDSLAFRVGHGAPPAIGRTLPPKAARRTLPTGKDCLRIKRTTRGRLMFRLCRIVEAAVSKAALQSAPNARTYGPGHPLPTADAHL